MTEVSKIVCLLLLGLAHCKVSNPLNVPQSDSIIFSGSASFGFLFNGNERNNPIGSQTTQTDDSGNYQSNSEKSSSDQNQPNLDGSTSTSPGQVTPSISGEITPSMPNQNLTVSSGQNSLASPDQSSLASPDQSSLASPDQNSLASPDQPSTASPGQLQSSFPNEVSSSAPDPTTEESPAPCSYGEKRTPAILQHAAYTETVPAETVEDCCAAASYGDWGSFTYDGETKECFLSSFWRDNNGLQNLLRDMELNSPVIIAYFANRLSGSDCFLPNLSWIENNEAGLLNASRLEENIAKNSGLDLRCEVVMATCNNGQLSYNKLDFDHRYVYNEDIHLCFFASKVIRIDYPDMKEYCRTQAGTMFNLQDNEQVDIFFDKVVGTFEKVYPVDIQYNLESSQYEWGSGLAFSSSNPNWENGYPTASAGDFCTFLIGGKVRSVHCKWPGLLPLCVLSPLT